MLRLRLVEGIRQDGPLPAEAQGGHMKVAFATGDLHTLDAHFAGARNLAIYDVGPDGHRFLEAVRFDEASKQDGLHEDDGHDRLNTRLDALDGCALLFVLAIGGPAAARVVAKKVHPVKLSKPEPIAEILARVQTMLNGTPPPWLRKAMRPAGAAAETSFLDEEEDA
jgi:nitrogen fixation protein NifX